MVMSDVYHVYFCSWWTGKKVKILRAHVSGAVCGWVLRVDI